MPKDEWGVKRLCPHCASRFYDLKRDPMTCPECGHGFSAESLVANRGRVMIAEKAVVKERDLDLDDLADDTDLEEAAGDVELDDDLLEDDEDDNVSLDDIADVGGSDDEV
ncbi:MAG TPA: TIGR02300 family protein [Paracoccaceae bacterium]|nr:TIGR02300 family protein [Paracoccaceae bacterium]